MSVPLSSAGPDLEPAGRLDQELQEAVVHRFLDEDPRAGAAVLAGVAEHRARRCRGGALEVRVLEDHVGGLAAELEGHALDRLGGAFHHPAADLRRAGEADLGDVRVRDQALAGHRTGADDDVDDALGDARLQRELGEAQRRERRQLGRLEDDRVPAGERGPELPAGEHQREVPRHDQPDHSERFAKSHVHAAGDRDGLAVVLLHGSRVEVEDVGHHAHLPQGVAERLADVRALQLRQAFASAPRAEPPCAASDVRGRPA